MTLLEQNFKLAEELSRYSRLCYDRHLVGAAGGNLSVRIPGTDFFIVTASGVALRDVAPDNVVIVDADGKVVENPSGLKPSKEISFHLSIFRARPQVNAVVHVHPPYAIYYATQGREIPKATISAILKLRQGPIVPEADPGSAKLCQFVTEAVEQAPPEATVLLMEKHGLITFRPTLCDAFDDAELAEDTAKVVYLSDTPRPAMPFTGTIIDLSIPLNENVPYYPTDPPFRKSWHLNFDDAGANVSRLDFGAHAGTHVDAPLHFLKDGADITSLPCSSFMGEAIVIDAPKKTGEEITLEDIDGIDIRENDIVLFRTGWEERAGTQLFFADEWPGLTPELTDKLIAIGVKAIGGDFASIDSPAGIKAGVLSHKKALNAGLPIFEALVNLKQLTGKRCFFIGMPLRIVGGEASPIRAIAILN